MSFCYFDIETTTKRDFDYRTEKEEKEVGGVTTVLAIHKCLSTFSILNYLCDVEFNKLLISCSLIINRIS